MVRFKKTDLCGAWKMAMLENEKVGNITIQTRKDFESFEGAKINAEVPGNFELDLFRAGLLKDPYVGLNVLKLQELENFHIWYQKSFLYDEVISGEEYLVCEGIDTLAEIYLNGKLVAKTDNMLIPYELPLDNLVRGENDLIVHILPAALAARSYTLNSSCNTLSCNYDALHIRKAPHTFGWDIAPRIVSGGIWRPAYIIQKPKDRIDDVFVYTKSINTDLNTAFFGVFFSTAISSDLISGYKFVFSAECGQSKAVKEHVMRHTDGKFCIGVENARLWWPHNMGESPLYTVTVQLFKDDTLLDEKSFKTGIRTIQLENTGLTDSNGSGEFCFYINNVKSFIKGTNWVPADAFHSNDKARLPHILPMIKDIGCNMIRCWGGNVYEDDLLFNYCDENGILIWQDFAMACAIYPQDRDFCEKLEAEAEIIVKRLRNHCSLALWAGDNECDLAYTWCGTGADPNDNKLTRQIIPEVLFAHDSTRPYLPSSPYISREAYRAGGENLVEDHTWGPRDYFKSEYYLNSTAHFASEVGYHGCPSVKSLKKFLSKDKLWPGTQNDEWRVHATCPDVSENADFAYRVDLIVSQAEMLFGEGIDNIEDFAIASQISQAEANKFFVERFRSGMWRRTGLIWWNLIDCWPQFSDAVVDYYYEKKLAYSYIKRSQENICLMFSEPSDGFITLVCVNDTLEDKHINYYVKDITNGEAVLSGEVSSQANSAVPVEGILIDPDKVKFYLISWDVDGKLYMNHYLSGPPPYSLKEYLIWMKKADFCDVKLQDSKK